MSNAAEVFVHSSAIVDEGAVVGSGTSIWHFCHVSSKATIGKRCSFGQNCFVAPGVIVGNNVKVQNNVSLYTGTSVHDDVFLGPSCVLTNVSNPRSQVNRRAIYETTEIRRGASVGANATIVCGVTLGRYCFVAAGSVVTKDVQDYALIVGVPGRQKGWISRHGHPLELESGTGVMVCPESGLRYSVNDSGELKCLDVDEEDQLSEEKRIGTKSYREFRTTD